MVIVALLLLILTKDTVAELAKVNDDETPESVAPTRTAMMKSVPGT